MLHATAARQNFEVAMFRVPATQQLLRQEYMAGPRKAPLYHVSTALYLCFFHPRLFASRQPICWFCYHR
jgi:hypothetical protein